MKYKTKKYIYIHPSLNNETISIELCSVMSDSLWPHRVYPARLLCLWDFPGKNTRLGYHFLLQRIFLTQGSNPWPLHFLHWQEDSLPPVPPGKSPNYFWDDTEFLKSLDRVVTSALQPYWVTAWGTFPCCQQWQQWPRRWCFIGKRWWEEMANEERQCSSWEWWVHVEKVHRLF